MTMQMYILRAKASAPPNANETIADFIVRRQGFILMATGSGALIVGLDDSHFETLKGHILVEFAGPVSFNPHGKAAASLQRIFANNVARQMLARGQMPYPPDPRRGGGAPN